MVTLLVLGGIFFLAHAGYKHASGMTAEDAAQDMIGRCKSDADFEKCYEREVPKLYPQYSFPFIFHTIHLIRSGDARYQFCHLLAHKIGAAAVAEDPTHWLDLIRENPPDGLCSNGFIHGVIIGRFAAEVLTDEQIDTLLPDLARACEPRRDWTPSSLDQAMCYHGIGHLLTYITDAQMSKAAAYCEPIARHSEFNDFTRVCLEGVFMQIYQPVEPDDFELIAKLPEAPTPANYRRRCAQYGKGDSDMIGACLREAWPLFRAEINAGTAGKTFCSRQPDAFNTQACYDTIVSIVGRGSLSNPEAALTACSAIETSERLNCYSRVALSRIEEDRTAGADAVAFCARAGDYADGCNEFLASRASYVFANPQDRNAFCALLPKSLTLQCAGGAL